LSAHKIEINPIVHEPISKIAPDSPLEVVMTGTAGIIQESTTHNEKFIMSKIHGVKNSL
jgi:hypothetical protein